MPISEATSVYRLSDHGLLLLATTGVLGIRPPTIFSTLEEVPDVALSSSVASDIAACCRPVLPASAEPFRSLWWWCGRQLMLAGRLLLADDGLESMLLRRSRSCDDDDRWRLGGRSELLDVLDSGCW